MLLLDDDLRIPPEFVERHLRNYENDPEIDGVSGQTLLPGQKPVDQLPPEYQWPGNGWMFLPLNYAKRRSAINWPSCNGSIRRTMMLKAGGFDEQFVRTYCDDTELSWRFHLHGAKIVFDPDATLTHLKIPSGGKRPKGVNRLIWADTEYWGTLFYFWRKCFGVTRVWRHVWWYVRYLILRKAVLLRPYWLIVNFYHLMAGFRWAGKRLREGPRYLSTKCI